MPLQSPIWQYKNLDVAGLWFPYAGQKRNAGLSADISPTGRYTIAYTSNSGSIMLRLGSGLVLMQFEERDSGITARHPSIRYHQLSGDLVMDYEMAAGGIARQLTNSEGRSWTAVVTISTSGTLPSVAIAATGVEYHFWRNTSEGIDLRLMSKLGAEVGAVRTVVANGVAADSIAAWFDALGVVYLTYRNNSGQIVTVKSTNGMVFA